MQDACPGGHAALAERDDSLRQHYNTFTFMSFGHAAKAALYNLAAHQLTEHRERKFFNTTSV